MPRVGQHPPTGDARQPACGAGLAQALQLIQVLNRHQRCEVFLALVDIHETWFCEDGDDDYGYGCGRGWYDDDDDDDEEEDNTDTPDLVELIDTEVQLRHRVGTGKPSGCWSISDEAICFTKATVEMESFEFHHEPSMGNCGDTVDHWYHRAAVVLWPRQYNFILRGRGSARWAKKARASG